MRFRGQMEERCPIGLQWSSLQTQIQRNNGVHRTEELQKRIFQTHADGSGTVFTVGVIFKLLPDDQ